MKNNENIKKGATFKFPAEQNFKKICQENSSNQNREIQNQRKFNLWRLFVRLGGFSMSPGQ